MYVCVRVWRGVVCVCVCVCVWVGGCACGVCVCVVCVCVVCGVCVCVCGVWVCGCGVWVWCVGVGGCVFVLYMRVCCSFAFRADKLYMKCVPACMIMHMIVHHLVLSRSDLWPSKRIKEAPYYYYKCIIYSILCMVPPSCNNVRAVHSPHTTHSYS